MTRDELIARPHYYACEDAEQGSVLTDAIAMLRSDGERIAVLEAERDQLRAELAASKRAIEALVEFASTVAPGSSWWDDTWPEHEAAMAGGG